MAARKLNILIISAEVAPFAKVGGLADVAGALPKALKALGHDVRVAMPAYKMVEDNAAFNVKPLISAFPVPMAGSVTELGTVKQTFIGDDIPVYLVGHSRYFTDATESKKVYTLEPDPYIFFDRAVTEFVPRLSPAWKPDIVHCNDWHTGLVPAYIEAFYKAHPTWSGVGRVFTIHNLAYQGDFDHDVFQRTGLPQEYFTFDRMEFYGKMNFLKGGVVFSEMVNTVSKTYASEIQTPEYGCALDGLLRFVDGHGRLAGIVNGIDFEEYNPASDPRIAAHFSADKPAGKAKCRTALQAEFGLPRTKKKAVVGLISRFADQKGFDLIHAIADDLLKQPIQLVVLGTGDTNYEAFFRDLQVRYPSQARVHVGFDAEMAQRIYAGCDMFLMPSRFEPCGLGQLMSLRYGTVPIVRATGGLADTIVDVGARRGKGTGFVFTDYRPEELLRTVERAVELFQNKEEWDALVLRALAADWSWSSSAAAYVDLFKRAVNGARLTKAA